MIGRGVCWGLLFFTIVLRTSFAGADFGELLSQIPRSYPVFTGFRQASTCHDLIEPTRDYIHQLQKEGHQLALIMNNGSAIPLPKTRLRDDFNGKTYNNINDYIRALESYVQRNMKGERKGFQDIVRRCLNGHTSKILPESCLVKSNIKYLHTGFIILDRELVNEPFVVHFYGDEDYNYLKGSIRVEALESYLDESKMGLCESKIVVLKKSAQRKIIDFFNNDHAQRLLAKGAKSFNLAAHPWKTGSQNCNIWASEVLASSLFVKPDGWNRSTRKFSKHVLAETGFKPTKMVFGSLFNLARFPAIFVGGVSMEEGNFIHQPYSVGDIVPTESIDEWLTLNGMVTSRKIIRGKN